MTILDSDIFAAAGGSVAKLYVENMVVKQGATIRSKIDGKVYSRYGSSPASLTLSVDPAVYYGEFTLEDNTYPIGSFKKFPYVYEDSQTVIIENGQWWLKSNNYLPVSSLPSVHQPLPDYMVVYGDYFDMAKSLASAGLAGTMMDAVGDGAGNWMCLNSAGELFVSTNNGNSWVKRFFFTTTNDSRIATNKTGRWWVCNNVSTVFVSDDLGNNWTQQTVNVGGNTTPAGLFKFIADKLLYAPITPKTIVSNTVTSKSVFLWITNTNSTSVTWTSAALNPTLNYPLNTNGTTFYPTDAIWDGNDTIWLGGIVFPYQFIPVVYKISTATFFTFPVAASTYADTNNWERFLGMFNNNDGTCSFVYHRPYINYSNIDLYPAITINTVAVQVTNPTMPAVTASSQASFDSYPLGGLSKIGTSLLMSPRGGGNGFSTTLFRQGPQTARAVSVNGGLTIVAPAALRLLREANGTILIIGTDNIWRSVPAVGRVPRTIGMISTGEATFTDYIRVV